MQTDDDTTTAAGDSPVDRGVRPRAWLREPKVQRHPGRHFTRGVTTTEPTFEDRAIAELDGDALVPLYDVAAIAAAVAREHERWRCEVNRLRDVLRDVSDQTRHPDYDWPSCLQREVDEALGPNVRAHRPASAGPVD